MTTYSTGFENAEMVLAMMCSISTSLIRTNGSFVTCTS